jgi:hypothetical protein
MVAKIYAGEEYRSSVEKMGEFLGIFGKVRKVDGGVLET